jgi:hypothetical protein
MKLPILVTAFAAVTLAFSVQGATYTTLNGEVNLVAGLTSLTSDSAINATNQSTGVQFITDNSWATGIFNLGGTLSGSEGSLVPLSGSTLAGTFGGQNYFGSTNGIIIIGSGSPTQTSSAWGSWTVRLLLSNDTYSSSISYTDSNVVRNAAITLPSGSQGFQNRDGTLIDPSGATTYYQFLDIAAFDPGNIGFKGIELSAIGASYPDLQYIGVTGAAASAIPEPTGALTLAGLLGGAAFLRRRRA